MASENSVHEKKQLLKTIFRVVSIVRARESKLRTICDTLWLGQLKLLNVSVLLRKLKFVIGNSSLRTIFTLHKKNLFHNNEDILEFVVRILKRRNLASPYTAKILQGEKKVKIFFLKYFFITFCVFFN